MAKWRHGDRAEGLTYDAPVHLQYLYNDLGSYLGHRAPLAHRWGVWVGVTRSRAGSRLAAPAEQK
eukprot:scaffold21265_cov131-Isochrysis_galbana.AAC.12